MSLPVFSISLTNALCPFATFREIRARQDDAFFFESADAIGEVASLSVIGVGKFEKIASPVFATLRARELSASTQGNIPYANGGYFGCIGYDAIAELEPKLASRGNLERRDLEGHQVLFASSLIVFDKKSGLIHFIGVEAARFEGFLRERAEVVAQDGEDGKGRELSADRLQATLGREAFFAGVATLKEHIREGDIFQAVLAERFECEIKVSAIEVFAALRQISPTPYSFFFKFGQCEFFGASPEALLKVADGRMRTHPIAGTRPRGKTEAEDRLLQRQLLRSRKEAAEHLMLVDLARNDLGRVARPGSVEVNFYRSIQKFSNVMHLVSEVDADLAQGRTAIEALGACFPAGTLSGAPKFRAVELLAGLEPTPRGLYGGAVLAFDPSLQRLDTCIAIRALEVHGHRAILRAGAGIVADSKAQFEYDEIAHKLKPLRQAIASAEGSK